MNKNLKYGIYLLAVFFLGFSTAITPSVYDLLLKNNLVDLPASLTEKIEIAKEEKSKPDLTSFYETYDLLKKEYVDGSLLNDEKKIGYGAAKGIVKVLSDPYSSFLDPKEATDFRNNLNGELDGIGAEVTLRDGQIIIVTPLKKSPAEKAGLKPDDFIYKINGESTENMSIEEAVSKIKGKKDTIVELTIIREGESQPLEFKITRDHIVIESVTMEEKRGNLVLVSINQFGDSTDNEFKKVVQEILIKKPKGMIIDLRFNGGGYLESAVNILSEIISGKEAIVSIKGRKSENNKTYYADGGARLNKIPLVVLVNRGSASASEIVAGAVQDLKRGLIIGEKTFGKGSVQEVFSLKDYSSLIITVAKWYTPLGRSIDKVGLTPDRIIPITKEDIEKQRDSQLEEALNYLINL